MPVAWQKEWQGDVYGPPMGIAARSILNDKGQSDCATWHQLLLILIFLTYLLTLPCNLKTQVLHITFEISKYIIFEINDDKKNW